MRSWMLVIAALMMVAGGGCRSAVVVAPKDPNTQTVVTVEERPTTSPSDKGLVVREK